MLLETRCPECKAKLRLDEAVDPDTPIECPRCGSRFAAPDDVADAPRPRPKPKAKRPPADRPKAKKQPGLPKKKKAKKKRTNPVVLLIAIGFGFVGLFAVGGLMAWYLNRPGKVLEMLAYVPAECNWARGVNVGQLAKYPGYASEVKKFYTDPVKAAADELAGAAGLPAEGFVDYLVIARNKPDRGSSGPLYVFRTKKPLPAGFAQGLPGAAPQPVGGETGYRCGSRAPGVLAGALVVHPANNPRVVVVVAPGPTQAGLAQAAAAAGADKSGAGSWAGALDATGLTVTRGSIWLVVKATGGNKGWIGAMTGAVSQDLKPVADAGAKAPTAGVWTTPGGGGVRMGIAMQCGSAKEAEDLVKSLREGPYGKGDESEPTNQLRQSGVQLVSNKKTFGEMMQYLSFKTRGECAYLVSKLSAPDNVQQVMTFLNNPTMGGGAAAD